MSGEKGQGRWHNTARRSTSISAPAPPRCRPFSSRCAAPGAGESISYGIPTLTLNGRDLVSFAAWKRHIGFYPLPALDEALAQQIAPYRAAKSSLRFPLNQPLPYDLIARLVALHVQQRPESRP